MKKQQTNLSPVQGLSATMGKNTLFGFVSNIAQIGTRLITVPIVIHHLGLGGYGIWNIIVVTATYMRFGSVGVKTAFQKYVAEATGDGDYEKANKLLSTGSAVLFVLSLAGLIPAALFSTQIATLAGVPPQFLRSSAGAFSLLALIMVMANVGAAFEAIVMGGHRIDLVRKFGTALSIVEAGAIVVALKVGYGLFVMSCVMGASELIYIVCCYVAAQRILPQIKIRSEFLSKSVLYELFRFAGSYQLVNLLEVLYASMLPFAVLRAFGADASGVYALVVRVVACAALLQDAFLPSLLSGGTMVFASGSLERMQVLLTKAFKVTLALSLFPLGFISVFGPTLTYLWTSETSPLFRTSFWLVSIRVLFGSLSLLALVLYRVSGKALLDNLRQVLRIVIIFFVLLFARSLGFYGVLTGMAIAELLGLAFMLFALTATFPLFRLTSLLPDAGKVTVAAAITLGAGIAASFLPLPGDFVGRQLATLRIIEVLLVCTVVALPTVLLTGVLTIGESAALFGSVLQFGKRPPQATICTTDAS